MERRCPKQPEQLNCGSALLQISATEQAAPGRLEARTALCRASRSLAVRFVKGGVGVIGVLLVQLFPDLGQRVAKSLEVYDLPLPEKTDHIGDVGIVSCQTENVVVSDPGLLLGGKVLSQVTDRIALDGHRGCGPGKTGGGGGIDAGGVVHKVGGEGGVGLDLIVGEAAGQLMDDGGYHFQMAQFFRPYIADVDAPGFTSP